MITEASLARSCTCSCEHIQLRDNQLLMATIFTKYMICFCCLHKNFSLLCFRSLHLSLRFQKSPFSGAFSLYLCKRMGKMKTNLKTSLCKCHLILFKQKCLQKEQQNAGLHLVICQLHATHPYIWSGTLSTNIDHTKAPLITWCSQAGPRGPTRVKSCTPLPEITLKSEITFKIRNHSWNQKSQVKSRNHRWNHEITNEILKFRVKFRNHVEINPYMSVYLCVCLYDSTYILCHPQGVKHPRTMIWPLVLLWVWSKWVHAHNNKCVDVV